MKAAEFACHQYQTLKDPSLPTVYYMCTPEHLLYSSLPRASQMASDNAEQQGATQQKNKLHLSTYLDIMRQYNFENVYNILINLLSYSSYKFMVFEISIRIC